MHNYQAPLLRAYILLLLTFSWGIALAQKVDTIYSSDQFKIIGDSSAANKIESILIKFQPFISFNDFKATSIYKGVKASIDYKSNVTAREFRTRISETYRREGVNFAGHYCFILWGCGSACQSSAIVDLITGKVYDGPSAAHRYALKKDSNMVIVNPPEPSGFYFDCPVCYPEIWVWNDRAKMFIQKGNK